MTEEECAKAVAYGMMAVEPGIDLLCLGEMGIGNSTAAAALCCALFGGDAIEWAGPGSGIDEHGLAHRYESVVDPRLNRVQSLEMAFLVAEMLRKA